MNCAVLKRLGFLFGNFVADQILSPLNEWLEKKLLNKGDPK